MDKHIGSLLLPILAILLICSVDAFSFKKEIQVDYVVMLMHDSGSRDCFDNARHSFYSDAEQNEISQNCQRINSLRYKRVDIGKNSLPFRPDIQRLYSKDRIQACYSNKVYSDSNGYLSQSVSGYYVFALRHIII